MNDNKFATGQILKKPVEVVKGQILAGWAQKSPNPDWIVNYLVQLAKVGHGDFNFKFQNLRWGAKVSND